MITTASSITRPIAIAIAPSVIRLNVCPMSHITNTVIASVSGIDAALIAVMRALPQEHEQDDHREHRADEHRVAHGRRGIAHERRLVVHRLERHARGQRLRAASPPRFSTLSAMATVLPPTCRVMLSSAAGRPSPATMRT